MENDSPLANLHGTEHSIQNSSHHTANVQRQEHDQSLIHKRALARAKKKSEYLVKLISNLDTLIYIELCIIYYME